MLCFSILVYNSTPDTHSVPENSDTNSVFSSSLSSDSTVSFIFKIITFTLLGYHC